MMMDTAVQQANNAIVQTPVTSHERQSIIQRLYEHISIFFLF